MSQVHELTMLSFAAGIEAGQQSLIMEALDVHISGCEGLISRDFSRSDDARRVEHVVWASQTDLEAPARLEEDPVVAELSGCFDASTVSYLRGVRVKQDDAHPRSGDEVSSL